MRPGRSKPGKFEVEIKSNGIIFPTHERTLTMKKLLIASAISAAFAAPTAALAQAARVPTLGQVLDVSGISVNGYIDAGYTHADRNVEGGIISPTTGTPTGFVP